MIDYKQIVKDILDPKRFNVLYIESGKCHFIRLSDNKHFIFEWRHGNDNIGYRQVLTELID